MKYFDYLTMNTGRIRLNKMKYTLSSLFYIFFVLVVLSCNQSDRNNGTPEQIIDRETMIRLMADMDITDAALKTKQMSLKHDSIRRLSNRAYDSLYLYYKTTPENFRLNVGYYQRDLEDYQKMMDEKIILLSKKKDSINMAVVPVKLDTTKIKIRNPGKKDIK